MNSSDRAYFFSGWYPDEVKGLTFKTSEALPTQDIQYQAKQKDKSFKTLIRKQSWVLSTQLVYDKKRWGSNFSDFL